MKTEIPQFSKHFPPGGFLACESCVMKYMKQQEIKGKETGPFCKAISKILVTPRDTMRPITAAICLLKVKVNVPKYCVEK